MFLTWRQPNSGGSGDSTDSSGSSSSSGSNNRAGGAGDTCKGGLSEGSGGEETCSTKGLGIDLMGENEGPRGSGGVDACAADPMSDLRLMSHIDFYLPYLPMRRLQVRVCAQVYV